PGRARRRQHRGRAPPAGRQRPGARRRDRPGNPDGPGRPRKRGPAPAPGAGLMSLILEALKKSEAERQRGKAPGLFVEQAVAPVHSRRTTPGWAYVLGLLLVVVVGVLV